MTFKEVMAQVFAWLQQDQRILYRALKRQFALDDDYLEGLKDALLYAYPQVLDDRRGFVWTGASEVPRTPSPTPSPAAPWPVPLREPLTQDRARSHFSDQAASKARCEVAIRFNMFHRPAL